MHCPSSGTPGRVGKITSGHNPNFWRPGYLVGIALGRTSSRRRQWAPTMMARPLPRVSGSTRRRPHAPPSTTGLAPRRQPIAPRAKKEMPALLDAAQAPHPHYSPGSGQREGCLAPSGHAPKPLWYSRAAFDHRARISFALKGCSATTTTNNNSGAHPSGLRFRT